MINNYKKNKKYIIIKDGNNYGLILGIVVLLIVLVLMFTSKLWLPDSRQNLSTKLDSELFFTMNTTVVDNYKIDYKSGVGELLLTQEKSSEKKKYDLTFNVYDDKGNKLPFEVIKGRDVKIDENSVKTYQDTLLQFGIYEDIYYVKIEIIQKDSTTQSLIIDYRSFENTQVLEKGKNYLINLEEERKLLNNVMDRLKPLQERSDVLSKELKSTMKLSKKERETKQGRIEELKKEISLLKEQIQPLEKEKAALQKKIKELE